MSSTIDHQDIKKEKILDAAHHRFLHYGYSKTTMNEIAGDLSISKALLYYYFPDKSQVYIAVMRKLASDYLKTLEGRVNTFSDLKEAFVFHVNTQHEFLMSNYNFFDVFRLNEQNLPDMIWEIVEEIHKAELDMLSQAIVTEEGRGTVKHIENPRDIVALLMDALHGVRVSSIANHKKMVFPKKEDLDEINRKRLTLVDIFVKGLKY